MGHLEQSCCFSAMFVRMSLHGNEELLGPEVGNWRGASVRQCGPKAVQFDWTSATVIRAWIAVLLGRARESVVVLASYLRSLNLIVAKSKFPAATRQWAKTNHLCRNKLSTANVLSLRASYD